MPPASLEGAMDDETRHALNAVRGSLAVVILLLLCLVVMFWMVFGPLLSAKIQALAEPIITEIRHVIDDWREVPKHQRIP